MTEPTAPHLTLHLCPAPVWEAQRRLAEYYPDAYAADGFIHCTDGDERLIGIANLFYASDQRSFVVLTVNLDANGEPWRYDDEEQVFPHIYGPIHPVAVTSVRPVVRAMDGAFLSIEADS